MGKTAAGVAFGLLWLTVAGVSAAAGPPPSSPGAIHGWVVSGAAQPLGDVSIVVQGEDGLVVHRKVRTGPSGGFTAADLPPGDYTVTATSRDLLSQSFDVIVLPGQQVDISFRLAADPAARARRRQAETRKQEKLVTKGLQQAAAGRYEEAVIFFREATVTGPDCAICLHNLGRAEMELGNYAAAEAAYRRAVVLDPKDAGAFADLGRIYNHQRRFVPAVEAGARAVALSVGSAPAATVSALQYNQGVYLWNAGRTADALEAFQAAVRVDPRNAEAQYRLALALINRGRIAPAMAALARYLALDPNGPNAAHARTLLAGLRQ